MRRILAAALLAAPFLLAVPGRAAAGDHPCSYGFGCGAFCLGLFSKIHQHGPLYNYGPYYGYAPFEPYGPWNAHLQWTGANYGPADCKGCKKSLTGNPHPLFGGGHRCKDGGCGAAACGTCGGATAAAPPAPAAMGQSYAGYPAQPNPYAAYGYAGGYGYASPYAASNYYYGPHQITPPAPQPSPVMPAGHPGR